MKTNINNIKNTWKGIRNLISWKQSASPYIHLLSQDNETVSNTKKISTFLMITSSNDLFENLTFALAEKAKAKVRFSNKSFDEFLQHPNKNSFFLRATSSDEITNLISLDECKSVGLPTKILRLLKNDISLQLTNIFNLSFSTGVFLYSTGLFPIHKKESKLKCSNYRPISLLSNLDKIMEKLIHNKIYEFLEKYKLIYPLQFGLRQHYSTSYALLNLFEWILKALDEGNFACGIFVDLEKAFDTVDYNIDDTNLLNINKSPKHLNKFVNIDLKNLIKLLNANKLSLNVTKIEIVLFRPKIKIMDFNLVKRLYETNSVKYLGIRIDNKLNWKPILMILHLN